MLRSLMLFAVLGLLVGCGSSTYERRLNETANYYAYINETEAVLDREWKGRGEFRGIKLRPPAGFRNVSGPEVETDDEGNVIAEGVDERQPTNIPGFYQGTLPGIAGMWKRNFKVNSSDGGTDFTARMYVLVQNGLGSAEGPSFQDIVYQTLATDLRVEDSNAWRQESYPARDLYARSLDYDEKRFPPGIAMDGFGAKGIDIQIDAYAEDGRSVVFVFFLPAAGMNSKESQELKLAIAKSLQSLEVSREPTEPEATSSSSSDSGSTPRKKKSPRAKAPAF